MVDIKGARALADFEVIEIVDDINPYLALLGIDWATDMNGVINMKKQKITFEKKCSVHSGTFRPCERITLHRASAQLRHRR